MKLFLVPITSRRTLLYAQSFNSITKSKPSVVDRVTIKAAKTWQEWEHGSKKWQRLLVENGNKLLRRIPYEEWGLKSVPALSSRSLDQQFNDTAKVDVVFPPSIIMQEKVPEIIRELAKERAGLHRSRLLWSIIGMPIVAPFALVPVIPNIPFFYLVFRAYSHWRALNGGRHLEYLFKNNLLNPVPHSVLDNIYTRNPLPDVELESIAQNNNNISSTVGTGHLVQKQEAILITGADAREIADAVEHPEIGPEIERALWQVNELVKPKTEKPLKTQSHITTDSQRKEQ